ncbi:unnamed protein product, partial [Didymodactylos carnosus]
CKICSEEIIGEECPPPVVALFVPCTKIKGNRCSFNAHCLNQKQNAYDSCLDKQKTNNAEKNKLIEVEQDAQRYLTENCDISKRKSNNVRTDL